MKKSVLIILVGAIMLVACSQYACPTYSKKIKKQPVKVAQV